MAKNPGDVKAALDVKVQKDVVEQHNASVIKHSDLAYVQEDDPNKAAGNKVLGKGGCGVVYLGAYRQVDGFVAIKELFINSASNELVAEFQNEAQIMGKLRSDYLVQFYGCCLSPKYALVMEYMPEGSLFNLLRSQKPLDWGIRYQISIQMSLGLEFLHDKNILHRDIKSLNVLLKNDRAKLSDFGLSRIKKESTSSAGGSVGTVQWMAPELFERKAKYTQKSDIYSLGMTFWEIASRQIPFADAENNAMISVWVGQGERETIPEDCPKKYKSLIFSCWKGQGDKADKLWKGQPSDRPTARQITDYLRSKEEDFEAFIAGKPASIGSSAQANVISSLDLKTSADKYPIQSENLEVLSMSGSATSKPNYLDNFASDMVDLKVLKDNNQSAAKPVVVVKPAMPVRPPPAKPTYIPQYQAETAAAPVKPVIKTVDAKEVKTYLEHIVWGRQDEAEAMLKVNKELALAAGDITDHAKRTFKNITGFQYAVWALDWKMWTMLLPYLPDDKAAEQARGFTEGSWVKEHGEYVAWKKLTDALQTYIDNFSNWNWGKRGKCWVNDVGGAQFYLPVHVLQEYNNPNRPFEPCPNFSTHYTLVRHLPDWLGKILIAGQAFDFGIFRPNSVILPRPTECCVRDSWGDVEYAIADHKALITLYDTRAQQRSQLVVTLLSNKLNQAQKAKIK
jgi:serine/threonine protein kinase